MSTEEIYARLQAECGGRLTTDTRTISGGEMFLALKGENFDGNKFALQALAAGARYAVVDGCDASDERLLHVPDAFRTLQELARYHRRLLAREDGTIVLGLTGTNGKTTTKELIRTVLASGLSVSATEGNLNNDIGVPLTLLRIPRGTQIAVVEMGANHPDDIAHLCAVVEPDYGLITNVGRAHLLGFGSYEGVQRAKGQLYDSVSGRLVNGDPVPGGKAVFVNTDDPVLKAMAAQHEGLSIIPYGPEYQGAKLLPPTAAEPFLRFRLGRRIIRTKLVGSYNITNVLAAIAVGKYFGIGIAQAAEAIASYTPSNNRSMMVRSGSNTLIVDAYNANPSSMKAALDNFSLMEAPFRVALLGDMRELGEDSLSEHSALVRRLADAPFRAILVGEEFRKALDSCGVSLPWFSSSEELAAELSANPIRDSVVLIKGSRGIKMETCIPALKA
ncbi:MAG: UDP-N-acetylmuramoyl-tripeptide--D-alanyl-D-alanine ligase [Bacteroidales bacterium]|nr:UDP-N-acetylmuramoyl-tripeptide--D-alanyl-D-alanine ligase [Bacteroidales bacterium]